MYVWYIQTMSVHAYRKKRHEHVTYILTACVWIDQVKLAYQESEVVALLKKIPLGLVEMSAIRERAEQLRDGNFCDYRPVLPLMLASFIFDVLCTPGKHQLLFDGWSSTF